MAIDANGHIIEDVAPGNADIWQGLDKNGNGVAESMRRFLPHGVEGGRAHLPFDPNAKRAILCVQHPASGNAALWEVSRGDGFLIDE
jgi:hypothetical protein